MPPFPPGSEEVPVRAKRHPAPSKRLTDASNSATPELSAHLEAIAIKRAEDARRLAQDAGRQVSEQQGLAQQTAVLATSRSASSAKRSRNTTAEANLDQSVNSDDYSDCSTSLKRPKIRKSHHQSLVVNSDSDSGSTTPANKPASKKRGSKGKCANPDPVDDDGFLADINLASLSNDEIKPKNDTRGKDVDNFFSAKYSEAGVDGKPRTYRDCKLCSKKGPRKRFVKDLSTCRRHLEKDHELAYNTWAQDNKFESMLPKAVTKRRSDVIQKASASQTGLDVHLRERPPRTERVLLYTDQLFREAATEWLISTDQPIQALEHPSFHLMIEVASRATSGVKIPDRKVTRAEIIEMFKKQMRYLRARLNGDTVKGEISNTCDAWQASNTDGYFAVSGHWIEEPSPGVWHLESALLGFTRLNNSHNGQRLGQVLFKIVDRLSIAHKIGRITCDNATNNDSMMDEFSIQITKKTGKAFDARRRRIRCLAHVINLATQALIKTHTKSKHYNPANPEDHMPSTLGHDRDEVGLIRAIAVKERSSAQRKQLFKEIQIREGAERPLQLLLDMPVRWSSTFTMLDRAETQRKYINTFIYEMGLKEPNLDKRKKIGELELRNNEWERVKLFLDLLAHADNAQQAFSSDQNPSLHLAVPALEALHKAWSSRLVRPKYYHFKAPLQAAIDKIVDYYEKTGDSDAYIIAMLLDPNEKMNHFKKYWDEHLQQEALESAEHVFQEYYARVHGSIECIASVKKGLRSGIKVTRLLRELSDDDMDNDNSDSTPAPSASVASLDPRKPWLQDFNYYVNTFDQLAENQTIVQWWGLNATRYGPVWTAIARDFLAIMASSVSSERAFSSAALTITKRRNRLKGDVVEALQVMKCLLRHDLVFRESGPSSLTEDPADEDDELLEGVTDEAGEESGVEILS